MTSVEKGDKYEDTALKILVNSLNAQELGINPELVRIYTKNEMSYYSRDRESHIKFDISMEIWPKEAENASIIYFIECKYYSHNVPIDDIEEFCSKITQVSGINAKGVFVTNSKLQKSALNFAKNKGLMLIYGDDEKDYKIVLYKKTSRNSQISLFPIDDNLLSSNQLEKLVLGKLDEVSSSLFNLNKTIRIENLSKEDIEEITKKIYSSIFSFDFNNRNTTPPSLSFENLKKFIEENDNIKVTFCSDRRIQGSCDIKNNTIYLNEELKGTNRILFILAHEYGHWKLHSKLHIGQHEYDSYSDSSFDYRTQKYNLENPKHWVEWQANYFASTLILPDFVLILRLFMVQNALNLSNRKIYIDYNQPLLIQEGYRTLNGLTKVFNTTKTSIIYRLKELSHFVEVNETQSIGSLIENYRKGYFL